MSLFTFQKRLRTVTVDREVAKPLFLETSDVPVMKKDSAVVYAEKFM